MNSLRLGVASVTFRQKTVEEIVEITKNNGVPFIEWGADVHVKSIDDAIKVKNLCEEKGIKISSYGSYYRVGRCNKKEWEEICKIANEMSAKSVRVWLGEKDSQKYTEDEYKNLLSDATFMCDIAEKYNLEISAECHDNTFNNNTDAFLRFKNDLKRDCFKTYFQSRYTKMQYDLDRIERTICYVDNVHVSYRDLKREQRFKKKDKKYIDKLIEKLQSKNFDGIVMIEFTKGNSEKNFMRDVKKLKKF